MHHVIVFSNSLGTDKGMWQPQVAAFEQQFKVVTYDTRGHGQSDVIEQTTVQNLAEDVIDILNGLNIEKAHFSRDFNGRHDGFVARYSSCRSFS